MTMKLVPYENGHLKPMNAQIAGIVVNLPGNGIDHVGDTALALTQEALWLIAPDGQYREIPLENIQAVKLQNFQGISIPRVASDGEIDYISPQDTAGFVIEYKSLGAFTAHISIFTYFTNNAQMWIGKIQEAVERKNRENYEQHMPRKLDP